MSASLDYVFYHTRERLKSDRQMNFFSVNEKKEEKKKIKIKIK